MNRYQNINIKKQNGRQVYVTTRYPDIPLSSDDIYIHSRQNDRFDILANEFYQDKSLWWVISIANPIVPQNTLVIPEGIQIRIPSNPSLVIDNYKKLNT